MPATTVRAERTKLSRERVLEAALDIMDREGLDAVTMRRVAREVGVEAMSLYHHVRDKEDLLAGVCMLVMREFRIPADQSDWLATARYASHEWRRVLKAHPNVISLFAERREPLTDVEALRPMEFALDVLRRAGLEGRDLVMTFNAMGGFIMGSVIMEVGGMFSAGTLDGDEPDLSAAMAAMPVDQLPNILTSLPHLAACDPDEQFEVGLEMLLAGLRHRLGSGAGTGEAPG